MITENPAAQHIQYQTGRQSLLPPCIAGDMTQPCVQRLSVAIATSRGLDCKILMCLRPRTGICVWWVSRLSHVTLSIDNLRHPLEAVVDVYSLCTVYGFLHLFFSAFHSHFSSCKCCYLSSLLHPCSHSSYDSQSPFEIVDSFFHETEMRTWQERFLLFLAAFAVFSPRVFTISFQVRWAVVIAGFN